MAKSKAQKHRAHIERNGGVNPERHRGIRPDFSMHTRTTPTLKSKKQKAMKKYGVNFSPLKD